MPSISHYFFEFVTELVEAHYHRTDGLDFVSSEKYVEKDLSRICGAPGAPFGFFHWFFAHVPYKNSTHPLNKGGQELFIDFFKSIHLVVFRDELKENSFSVDGLTHFIKFYRNPSEDDYTVRSKNFFFDHVLESLLESEYLKAVGLLEEELRKIFSVEEKTSSLNEVRSQVSIMKRTRLSPPNNKYESAFQSLFVKYSKKVDNVLLSFLPRPIQDVKTPKTRKDEKILQLRAVFQGLEFDKGPFISDETIFDDFLDLLIDNDYSKRIVFGADQGRCIYTLMQLKRNLNLKFELTEMCASGCLFIETKTGVRKLSNPAALNVSTSRVPPRDKDTINKRLVDLYSSINRKP